MRIALISTAAAAVVASAANAAPAPETSWGKAGVSFEEYRGDANRCVDIATHVDIAGTEPVRALITASRRIDTAYASAAAPAIGGGMTPGGDLLDEQMIAATRIEQERRAARPDIRFQQVRALLQRGLEECLVQLGYVRFRLTEDQRAHLRHLATGRPEREHYLHRLASDPAILAAQATPEPSSE